MTIRDTLIGSVTYAGKEYSREKAWQSIATLDLRGMTVDPVIVDNTADGGDYFRFLARESEEKWKGIFTIIHADLDSRTPARAKIAISQNVVRHLTRQRLFDALLLWESDVVLMPDTLSALASLDTDVAAGVLKYPSSEDVMLWSRLEGREGERGMKTVSMDVCSGGKIGSIDVDVPMPGRDGWEISRKAWKLSNLPAAPFDIEGCHLGCTLIKRKVLDDIRFDYHVDSSDSTDIWFSIAARKAGFRMMADPSVRPTHLPSSWRSVVR